MKTWEKLISDDLLVQAEGLQEYYKKRKKDTDKKYAAIGQRYYNGQHDILDTEIFYIDQDGKPQKDNISSNIKIPHPFFMEQVDQKVQHLLSSGVQVETEKDDLKERLDEYINEDFDLFINEVVEGASIKGVEFAYCRTNHEDKICFETSDYLQTDSIVDNYRNEVAVVRTYIKQVDNEEGEVTESVFGEIYTQEEVAFFSQNKDGEFEPDPSKTPNPRPHVVAIAEDDNQLLQRNYGRIPFYRLSNNRSEQSDLVPIKAIIDDYDRNASYLSNDLKDFGSPIFIVYGARGENSEKIKNNLINRGLLKVDGSPSGNNTQGVEILSHDIPIEARRTKLDIDKEAIYKFGLAFDSSQNDGSNLTNVAIQSRYSLLNLKCNKIEPRVRALIKWCLELILDDIRRRYGETYDINDIEVVLERNTITNENDLAQAELTRNQSKQTIINSLVTVAPYLDSETMIKEICRTLEIDEDEVLGLLDEEETEEFDKENELIEDDEEVSAE